MRAESRVVEVEKQCSMLEFDLKQSVQKMEQLMKQKERLEDEVSETACCVILTVLKVSFVLPKRIRCLSTELKCLICDTHGYIDVSVLQVKTLRIQLEQESSKRILGQNDLRSRSQEVDRLRCSEKQLKQEINTALESKRSLEFQLAQLTK